MLYSCLSECTASELGDELQIFVVSLESILKKKKLLFRSLHLKIVN
jgi:hypothetical protein